MGLLIAVNNPTAPQISTSPDLGSVATGAAIEPIVLQAVGGTQPYTWSLVTGGTAGVLPPGLALAANGRITGTPTTAQLAKTFTVRVTDAGNATVQKAFTIAVGTDSPRISSAAMGGARVGEVYSHTFQVLQGKPPYAWSTNSTLPAGLTLNPTSGVISGTPGSSTVNSTASFRDYPIALRLTASGNTTTTANFTLTVAKTMEWVTPPNLPVQFVGPNCSVSLLVSGGKPAYSFSVQSGSTLPPGMVLGNATGILSGKPSAVGNYSFTIAARDAVGSSISRTFAIQLIPYTLAISGPASGSGTQYSSATPLQFSAIGGAEPYKYSSTNLPPGLSINASTGLVTGTLKGVAGTSNFTVTVTDNKGMTANATCAFTVSAGPVLKWTVDPLPSGKVLQAYSANLSAASGGWGPYTYSVNASTLPAGLTFNAATRRLSGNATAGGNFSVVLTVRDSATPPNVVNATLENSTVQSIPLYVEPYSMSINGTKSLTVAQYAALSPTLFTVVGGAAPYTWSTTTTPPATLKLTTTGANGTAATLAGNATAAPGNYTIGVRVTDKTGQSVTSNVTLAITPLQVTWTTQPLLPAGKVASPYTTNLTISGGRPGYTYVLKNGSVLPAGLTLNAMTGVISGTPTRESAGGNSIIGGNVTTLAGSGTEAYADGEGTAASFNRPFGVAVDSNGNVYVADTFNERIRKISPGGNVSTSANQWGPNTISYPQGVALDGGGNLYVSDNNGGIWRISPAGEKYFLAGSVDRGYIDGQRLSARFNAAQGLAVDVDGNVFVADSQNNRIRKITTSGNVTTIAGGGATGHGNGSFADGQGAVARFNLPTGVAVDGSGNIYVADYNNHRIRKITASGNVTTLAGSGSYGYIDGQGTEASFAYPTGVAVGGGGNVYVADYGNQRIRKVAANGKVTTIAGSLRLSGYADGLGIQAIFSYPYGIAADQNENLYVSDLYNFRIRKITPGPSGDTFTIIARDSATPPNTAEREFSLSIASYGMAVGGPDAASGAQYSSHNATQFTVSGGVAPYRWSAKGLPAALSINAATGLVSGNLTAAPGNYTANITVTDNRSQTATKNYTVTISALPLAWSTNATLPAGKVADAYSTNLTVTSGRAPYTYALSNSTLPAGLALNPSTGLLSGTPTAAGNYSFTINASDSAVPKNAISRNFTLTIAPYGMAISGPVSISGQQFNSISPTQFLVSGGAGNYTWSTVPSPAVPAALSINATTGLLSGNFIAASGNYTLGIKVTDKIGQSVTTNLTITILPGTPLAWVTAANLPNAKVATPYSTTLQSTGGLGNYTYTLKTGSALPPGLKLSTYTIVEEHGFGFVGSQVTVTNILGTPTTAGTYKFTLVARDSLGNTVDREFTLVVAPYGMSIAENLVISGKRFTSITPVQLTVTGGTANYTWSANSTTGLAINSSTGLLSGNLTAAPGNYTLIASVRDGRNQTATRNLTVSILQVDPITWVTNATLTPGKVAENYSANLTVKDGTPPYNFALKTGSVLPGNLTLNATSGALRGTPATAGNFTFTLVAKDSGNATTERAFTLAVAPYGMAITNEPPITGQMNQAFSYPFTVSGGIAAYTWNATGAPTGLTMNATTGILSGTPTASGNFATSVRVTDGKTQTVSRNYTISIGTSANLSISTPPNLGTIDISKGYTTTLQAVGGRPPYTWTINGTKPASVNLAANGTLTANSSTALTANFTVRVQDSSLPAANATQAMTIVFRDPNQLAITTTSLPQGRASSEYSHQLAATGGKSPYQWVLKTGTLPTGLELSPTGWLIGTTNSTSNATLTFEVTDSAAVKATRQLQLVIGSAAGNTTASGKLFTDVTSSVNLPEHFIIAVEDFDNDGREDLLATNSEGSVVLLRNVGAFDFRDITANSGLADAQPALVADFNNDGVSDVLSVNLQRTEATLFLNNGQGVFTKQPLTGLLTGDLANYRDISFADADGDGDLDLLFNINAASGGAVVAVFNQSNVSQTTSPLLSGKSYLVKTTWKNAKFSVTDANGDGKPDLVVLQTNGVWPTETHRSNPASLYLNTGNTTADYANPTGTKTLAGFTQKLNCGITGGNEMSAFTSFDIDNDGDLDLLNGSSDWPSASVPRIFINDSTGTYTQKDSPILHGSYYHHGATIFDADLDGDQDAVWTSLHVFKDVYPRMWENGATYLKATANGTVDPAKAFYDSTTDWGVTAKIPGSGNMGSAGYVADLDGDGDLDFVTNLWSNTTTFKVYRNDANLRQANWLEVELIGAVSPAQGTGARVEVELKDARANKPAQVTGASRYEIVTGNFTWTQAKADAEARGGHLATITSNSEWNLIVTATGSALQQSLWAGAYHPAGAASASLGWQWVTGEQFSFTKWFSGEPNDPDRTSAQYLTISWPGQSFGAWNDAQNTDFAAVKGYLLEREDPTATTKLSQYLGNDIGSVTNSSLTFGLADKTQAAKVTVYWPSGLKSVLENVDGNRTIQIREADEMPLPRPTDEGDVIAWGANPNGETTIPSTLGKAVQIAAGDSSSAALRTDGTVSAWGTNWAGQLNIPAGLKDVVQIAAGNHHYLALTSNGSVLAWGWNTANQTVVPTTIRRAKLIAAGFNSSYALLGDGRIIAWGGNDVGQLNVPAGLSGVTALSAGRGHVLALKSNGTVVAWGRNDLGQATVPPGLSNVIQIATGDYHSLALKSDGTVVAWGANWIKQSTIPAGLTNVVQISAKGDRSLALKADNSIVTWGLHADTVAPPPAPGTMLGISAGSKHSLGLVRKIQIALTADLPVLKENQALSGVGLTATGGSGNYTWSIVGAKPDWISINATTGQLTGTPTAAGNQTVTVRVSSGGRWSDRTLTFEIQKAVPTALWVATTGNNTTGDGSLGKPFATITKAHSVAIRGDVIKVLPGNYTESLVIEKAVEISSTAGPAQTTIRSAGLASAVYGKGSGIHGGKLIGFTITGGGGANNPGYNRYGGGLAINAPAGTTYEVVNCIIRNNTDAGITFGGGFHVTGGSTLKLTNSLVHSNSAWANGGAALIDGANLIADRCTIVSNTNNGFNRIGGISAAGNCYIQIKNSILWSNTTNQYGSFSSGPAGNGTFSFSYSIVQGGTSATVGGNTKTIVNTGMGVLSSDPKFSDTTNYSLGTGSPAIDTGDPAAAKDADGSRANMGWDSAAAAKGSSEADSDGDGVQDAIELQDGTNPFDPTSFEQLSQGLIRYYTFNGTYANQSGTKADAIPQNAVNFVTDSFFGKAVKITGADFIGAMGGTIEIPAPNLNPANQFTASFWIKEHGMSHWHGESYLTAGTGSGSRYLVAHFGVGSSEPYLATSNSLTNNNHADTTFKINDAGITEIWNFYTIVEQSGVSKIFLNGKELYSVNTTGLPVGNWHIGRHWWDGGYSESTRLIASLANLRIYNRALNAAEVTQLYAKESEPIKTSVSYDLGQVVAGGNGLGNSLAGNEGKTGIDTTTGNFTSGMNFGHTYYNGYNLVSKSTLIDGVFNLGTNNINSSNVTCSILAGDASNASFDYITNNREIGGSRSLQLGNKTYSSGIGISSGSGITFNLKAFRNDSGAKSLTFSADFGTMSGGNWKVRGYAILSSSSKVLENNITPILNAKTAPYQFYINIPNEADYLTLMVGAAGDGITDDHAAFGNARIIANSSYVSNANTLLVQGGALPPDSALANQTVSAFQLSRFETTWAEWKTVRTWAAANGYDIGTVGQGSADNHPVQRASWYDIVKWLNAKSEMEGLTPVYSVNGQVYRKLEYGEFGSNVVTLNPTANGYRLPMEAEWEFAARGGSLSQGYIYAGSNNVNEVAVYRENSTNPITVIFDDRGTWPIGTKKPNELGLYDMSGNLYEFCWDQAGNFRRARSGSWLRDASCSAINYRNSLAPHDRNGDYGFRYARNAIGDMITVQGGTMPAGSGLAGQSVQAFQIGRTEVTWGEWKSVRDWAVLNGYSDLIYSGSGGGAMNPVQNINWQTIVKWCNAKSEKEGLSPVYYVNGAVCRSGTPQISVSNVLQISESADGYRIPSMKEWFWAHEGGLLSQNYTFSGSNSLDSVAWTGSNSYNSQSSYLDGNGRGTWPAGLKQPNELGIFDMTGNVSEWSWNAAGPYFCLGGGCYWDQQNFSVYSAPTSNSGAGLRLARNIGPKISISGTMPEPTINQAYAGYTFTASGTTGAPVWSVSSGSLPPGMSFNATTATLSGTPTTAGNYTFTIKVASGGYSDEKQVVFDVKKLLLTSFATSFTTTLQPGIWHGFILGPSSENFAYIPKITPKSSVTQGGLIDKFVVQPEFDGTKWNDVLRIMASPLNASFEVDVRVFKMGEFSSAPVASSLSEVVLHSDFGSIFQPSEWRGFILEGTSNKVAYVPKITPRPNATQGAYIERTVVQSEFNGTNWYDVLRVDTADTGYNFEADLRIFKIKQSNELSPSEKIANLSINSQFQTTLQPGVWHGFILGPTSKDVAYVPEITPLSSNATNGAFVEKYTVQSEFNGTNWFDVLRMVIPQNQASTPVHVRIYKLVAKQYQDMVTVQGGTLPAGSGLVGQAVEAFQIGKYEVTWGEWKTVRTWAVANGYTDLANIGAGSGDDHPVHSVNWYDVVKWCNAKSQKEGLIPVYQLSGATLKTGQSVPVVNSNANGYRLPTEAEWEWAARGGPSSKGYTYSGSNDVNAVAWYSSNGQAYGGVGTNSVGTKSANELGISDMSGNVMEWCWDWAPSPYRRIRGGSWETSAGTSTVAHRYYFDPVNRSFYPFGFRLTRNIGPKISISGTMPEPTLNQAYAGYTFTASGATGAPTWSVSSGSLPPGMSFNATTATLSGTPTTAGNYTFTIKVASGGYSDEVEVELQVSLNFIDNGNYTTVKSLGIDVYDVYAFQNMTYPELEAAVTQLGGAWRVARADEVRPIFNLLSESEYVSTVKNYFGFTTISPNGTPLYNTGGRVSDTYPNSTYPHFRYLWGFGNGVQLYPNYIWSTYGIGMDIYNSKLSGAWVIRQSVN